MQMAAINRHVIISSVEHRRDCPYSCHCCCHSDFLLSALISLQCFNTDGCVAGRASSLWKTWSRLHRLTHWEIQPNMQELWLLSLTMPLKPKSNVAVLAVVVVVMVTAVDAANAAMLLFMPRMHQIISGIKFYVKVVCPTWQFLPRKSLGLVLKKPNLTQKKTMIQQQYRCHNTK